MGLERDVEEERWDWGRIGVLLGDNIKFIWEVIYIPRLYIPEKYSRVVGGSTEEMEKMGGINKEANGFNKNGKTFIYTSILPFLHKISQNMSSQHHFFLNALPYFWKH